MNTVGSNSNQSTSQDTKKSRRKYDFFGNWKMAQTREWAIQFLDTLSGKSWEGCRVAIFPSFIHLSEIGKLKGHLLLGAQDCSTESKGAFTGEVSAASIRETGAEYVLIGHSERRLRGGETSESLRMKIDRAYDAGLQPVYCIGENEKQRSAGKVFDVLREQLKIMKGESRSFLLAYEPVWAIGTGKVAALTEIAEAHQWIWNEIPQAQSLLYGGSVKPENSQEILALESVTGLLIGGASLRASDFEAIITSRP